MASPSATGVSCTLAGHIAQGMDGGHAGLVVVIHDHRTLGIQLDAGGFQTQASSAWSAPCGKQYRVGFLRLAGVQMNPQAGSFALQGSNLGAQTQIDAGLAHFCREKVPHIVIKTSQQTIATVQLGHPGPQALEDGCELAGDVATANHHQPRGEGVDIKNLVGGQCPFTPGDVRHHRLAAGRDQQMAGRNGLAVHRCTVRTGDLRNAGQQGHPRLGQQVLIDAVKAQYLRRSASLQGSPVQARGRALPAKAGRLFKGLCIVGGIAVQLFGDAAYVDTGATPGAGTRQSPPVRPAVRPCVRPVRRRCHRQ
jgi:hypothetical protein